MSADSVMLPTQADTIRFFLGKIERVIDEFQPEFLQPAREAEIRYAAHMLAFFAHTPARQVRRLGGFRSLHEPVSDTLTNKWADPSFRPNEVRGGQILWLTGYFKRQLEKRYPLGLYSNLGRRHLMLAANSPEAQLDSRLAQHRLWVKDVARHFAFWQMVFSEVQTLNQFDRYLLELEKDLAGPETIN